MINKEILRVFEKKRLRLMVAVFIAILISLDFFVWDLMVHSDSNFNLLYSFIIMMVIVVAVVFVLSQDVFKYGKQIKLLNERFAIAVDSAEIGVWDWDLVNNILIWDEWMYRLYGIKKDDFGGAYEAWLKGLHPDDLERAKREINNAVLGEREFNTEFRVVKPSGDVRYIKASAIVVRDNAGKAIRMTGINYDITERKEAEKIIKKNHSDVNTILNNMPFLSWLKDLKGRFLAANELFIKSCGLFSFNDLVGKTDLDIWPKHLAELYRKDDQEVMLSRKKKNVEELVKDKGVEKWFETYKSPLFDADGNVVGTTGFSRDISERKQVEDLLKKTHQNYETFFNTIDDFLFVLDETGNVLYTNNTVINRLEYTKEELVGKSILLVHPCERRDEAGRVVGEMLAGSADFCPVPLVTKFGKQISVETRVTRGYWDGKPVLFGVSKDISKIKLSEEKFSKAFHSNPVLMALSKFDDGIFIDVNDSFLKALGYSLEEVIGKSSEELNLFVVEGTRNDILEEFKQYGTIKDVEIAVNTKEGIRKVGLFSLDTIYIGKELCLLTVFVDISEQKKIEDSLLEKTALLTDLLHSIPDIVFFKNTQGVYLGCNPEFAKFVNKEISNIVGFTDYELFGKEIADFFREQDRIMLEQGIARHNEEWITYVDGTRKLIDTFKAPLRDTEGQAFGLLGISRDITERKLEEEELKKALEVKNTFTSTVSHELRTPLAVIMEGIKIVLDGSCGEINEEQKDYLSTAERNVDRLGRLINDVLDIQKLEAGMMKFIMLENDFNLFISEFQKTMIPIVKKSGLDFEIKIDENIPKIAFDNDKIEQVLTNLINNALKFTERGKIVIETQRKDNYIQVSVSDTGIGIKKEDLNKLFGKFEQILTGSARKTGGTGLGLSICKEIINRHGGKIWADSEYGKGTTFSFTLPMTERRG